MIYDQAKTDAVRLDLWLWAARFYKTRSLAKAAVEGRKVRVNVQPCKPAKAIHIGDLVHLVQGNEALDVRVQALSEQRASAVIAATLYSELPESLEKRLSLREQTRFQRLGYQAPASKPDKRDRRRIIQFELVDVSGDCLTLAKQILDQTDANNLG